MKKLIYLLGCLLVACHEPSSQNSIAKPKVVKPKTGTAAPSNISEIKAAYTATMHNIESKKLDSIAMKYDCNGERSGTITYYLLQGKLQVIKHAYAEYSHHEASDLYFVQDTSVYFTYFQRLNWSFDSDAAAQGATKDDITENRFYLVANKPVHCLEKKYTIHSVSSDKVVSANMPNYTVDCNQTKPILGTFKKLLAFKDGAGRDCFYK